MKNLLRIAAAALALALAPLALAGTFGTERAISSASFSGQFPEVAYYNNVIHVAWVGYPPGPAQSDIYYAYSTDAGQTWSVPINLSNTSAESEDRPQVTAGPNGVYVGWNTDNDKGAVLYARSTTLGTFGAPVVVADSGPNTYSRITHLFTDSGGDVHVMYFDNGRNTDGTNVGQVRERMICGGTTFGPDTAITSKEVDGDVDNEEPRIAEAGGKFHVAFKSSRNGDPQGGWPPYSIQMASGTKAGCAVSWVYPPRRVAGGVPFSFADTFRPAVFGDPAGNVHLAWWDDRTGSNVMYRKGLVASSTLGAASKLSSFNVDHLEPGGIASTAAAAAGGFQVPPGLVSNGTEAFVAYQKNVSSVAAGYENGPIYLRESTNNGTSWNAEVQLSGTSQATTPRLAIGGPGTNNVAIVWADIRSSVSVIYFRLYTLNPVSGAVFSFAPASFDFGSGQVTTQSTHTFTLSNTGSGSGAISSIGASGDFTIASKTCGTSLANGASCTVTVRFTPAALGARSGALTAVTDAFASPTSAPLSGTGAVNTAAGTAGFNANASAVVTGYYETILRRSPDGPGLAFWSAEAARVNNLGADVRETFYAMAMQFFGSTEYLAKGTSDTQYVVDLYHTFFVREPDGPGLAFWLAQLTGGMDRGALLNNFLFSTEFVNFMSGVFGSPAIRPEVNMTMDLFRGSYGRLPDDSGFNFWLGQVRAAQCQGAAAVSAAMNSISSSFLTAAEYGARDAARPAALRNAMYVGDLYNLFLRRGGDLGGYLFWVNVLNTGQATREAVRATFVQSPEFQARVNAVIAAGCSPP